MGPLAQLWLAVDKVTNHNGDENPPKLPIAQHSTAITGAKHNDVRSNQQSASLRKKKINVLRSVMNNTKNSSTLKEQVEVLSKSSDLLFENDFRDHVLDSSKAKRKSSHEKSRW